MSSRTVSVPFAANTLKQTTQCNHRTASFLCFTADIESAIPAYNTPFNKGVTNQEKSVSGNNQDGQVAYTVYQ